MSMSSRTTQLVEGLGRLRCQAVTLSREARLHLEWMRFYETHGRNARLTCRRFGISPQTFYRWKRRYDPHRLVTLENASSRPKTLRRPTWSRELEDAIRRLREQYPRWGKEKLKVLLARQGLQVSVSMVGRVLKRLKQSGRLVEPLRRSRSHRRRRPRAWAVRKPWNYLVRNPGDLVQVDTKDLRPLPGVRLKQFTARDRVSRWDVLSVHERATSTTAASFLDEIHQRMPFPVRAIQVDGGSEFKAVFEAECQKRRIHLFDLPPRSPKLNAHVERSNRTHQEEFHEVYDLPWTVAAIKPACLEWERVYNTVRPHQSLGMKTPLEFVNAWRRSHLRRQVSPRY